MNSFNLGVKQWLPPDESAAREYFDYTGDLDHDATLAQFDDVIGRANHYVVGPECGIFFRNLIKSAIADKRPSSFIRIGDGEGNILFSMTRNYKNLSNYCLRKISVIHFGDQNIVPDNENVFDDILTSSILSADAVGIPERGTLERGFSDDLPNLDVRGMCGMRGVYNYFFSCFPRKKLGALALSTTWFSRYLLPHYFGLLNGQDFLGLITCYDELAGLLQKKVKIGRIETILVPTQASIARKMKEDSQHYPRHYLRIIDAIRPPAKGAVYLVAAGLLSKSYCTVIKERGGIAIDIGSVADVWMNITSRPGMSDGFVDKWRLKEN